MTPEPGFRRLRFLKHSAIYGAGQLLVRGISVILLPFYTRLLTPSDYGVMETIGIAVAFLTTALPLEISQAVGRFYTDSRDDAERRTIASTALWFTLAVFSIFAIVPLLSAPEVSRWMLASDGRSSIIRVAAVGLVLQGLFYLTMEQLRWQIKPELHALTAVTSTLILIGVTAVLILGFHSGVIGVFYGQVAGNCVGVVMALWFGRSYAFRFDPSWLRKMLAYAAPLVPSTAALVVASMVDRIAIRTYMSLAALGIYGIANRFGTVIALVMLGVNGAFMPLVLRHHRDQATPGAIADIFRYFVYLATIVFLGMSLFSGWILRIIATPVFYAADGIVPVVVLFAVFSSMWVFAPGLVLAKRTRVIAGINIAAAAVNTVLVFSLVPRFGLMGAAVGTAISFFGAFATLMVLSQRAYPAPHRWLKLSAAFAVAAAAVIAGRLAFHPNPAGENAASFLIEAALFIAAGAVVSLVLLDRREVGELLRRLGLFSRPSAAAPSR
jgi:O-antigen/teichoic acid export membrane protein